MPKRKVEVTEAQSEAPMPKAAEPQPDEVPADSSVLASPEVDVPQAGEMQSTPEPSLAPEPSGDEPDTPQPHVDVEVGDGDGVPEEATGEPAVADESDLKSAKDEKVLFADSGLTVHVALSKSSVGKDPVSGEDLYDVRGVSLSPGQTVPLSDLPPYLQKSLKNGEVAGARLISSSKAKELNEEAQRVRELASQTIGVESDMVVEVA